MTQAYVYKLTHIPTLNWYIGSRTAKKCHPDDGYMSSSKIVKAMFKASPKDWKKEIIEIGTPEDMLERETEILQLFDAKNDPRSYNKHNNDGNYKLTGHKGLTHSDEARKKMSDKKKGRVPWNKGLTGLPKQSDETKAKRNNKLKGQTRSDETKKNMSDSKKGYKHSEESKQKMSENRRGENNNRYGVPHTEEARKRISESNKETYHNKLKKSNQA
jgi:hypothetical protein